MLRKMSHFQWNVSNLEGTCGISSQETRFSLVIRREIKIIQMNKRSLELRPGACMRLCSAPLFFSRSSYSTERKRNEVLISSLLRQMRYTVVRPCLRMAYFTGELPSVEEVSDQHRLASLPPKFLAVFILLPLGRFLKSIADTILVTPFGILNVAPLSTLFLRFHESNNFVFLLKLSSFLQLALKLLTRQQLNLMSPNYIVPKKRFPRHPNGFLNET